MALITTISSDVELKAIGDVSDQIENLYGGVRWVQERIWVALADVCGEISKDIWLELAEWSRSPAGSPRYEHRYKWGAPGYAEQTQDTGDYVATLRIVVAVANGNIDIEWYADDTLLDSHTIADGGYDWGLVESACGEHIELEFYPWVRCYDTTIIREASTYNWAWDSSSDLDDWFYTITPAMTGGYLYDNRYEQTIRISWPECGWTPPALIGDKIAMTVDPTGVPWYAWLEGDDLKINRFTSETGATVATAMTVDSSGDYDSVTKVQFTGGIIRVIVRNSTDELPYLFYSEDFGATWTGPTDVS